jgi:hypothetical protein
MDLDKIYHQLKNKYKMENILLKEFLMKGWI